MGKAGQEGENTYVKVSERRVRNFNLFYRFADQILVKYFDDGNWCARFYMGMGL